MHGHSYPPEFSSPKRKDPHIHAEVSKAAKGIPGLGLTSLAGLGTESSDTARAALEDRAYIVRASFPCVAKMPSVGETQIISPLPSSGPNNKRRHNFYLNSQ